jgi:outer membrane lipoprotein LolB
MNFHIARRTLAVALPLLLAGCASLLPPGSNEKEVPANSAHDSASTRPFHGMIDLGGRLSVRYQGPRNEEALHGNFTWIQTPTHTTVTLLSPLGQTIAVIDVSPQGATLTQGGQAMRSAADVDMLTAATLGWPLPIAGLRDWLQGFAVDNAGRRIVATPQAADFTTRDGWNIRYPNWEDGNASSSQIRPKRIDLARYTEQAGDVSIRIVIDSWQTH